MNRAWRFTLPSLAVLVVLMIVPLSACGGDSNSGASDSGTVAETAPETDSDTVAETAPQTVINDDDQAFAESSLLRLSDFPTGWRATKKSDEDKDPTALEECFTPDYAGVTVTGRAAPADVLER